MGVRVRSAAAAVAGVVAVAVGQSAGLPGCLLLAGSGGGGGDAARAAYWNASAQHGTLMYDEATDGVYLWPHALFSIVSPAGVPCLGVLAPPWDPAAPLGSSRYLLRRSAADVQARPYGGWAPDGVNVTAVATVDPPVGAFYSNNVVWMGDRRLLFAFGGVTVRDNVTAGDCPLQATGLLPGPGQCAVFSNDTHVLDLATRSWTHYDASAAGVPLLQPGPPAMHSPYTALSFHAMVSLAYDAQRGGVWLVGGKYAVSYQLSCAATQYGLFFFSLATGTWSLAATVGEGPCAFTEGPMASLSTMFVNPVRDELVVYSGTDGQLVSPSQACAVLSLWSTPMSWRADPNCSPVIDGSRNSPSYVPAAWVDPRPGGAAYVLGGLSPGEWHARA